MHSGHVVLSSEFNHVNVHPGQSVCHTDSVGLTSSGTTCHMDAFLVLFQVQGIPVAGKVYTQSINI